MELLLLVWRWPTPIIEETMNGKKYREILTPVRSLKLKRRWTFQKDNDPDSEHTAYERNKEMI